MPTKRNMKNYALVEVIQPKNYYELVKAKLCHNVEEIILSYVFYDSKRQTHACKLNLNYDMERLAEWYLNTLRNIRDDTTIEIVSYIGWDNELWKKQHCYVCQKPYSNFNGADIYEYSVWCVRDMCQYNYEVCENCNHEYNIGIFRGELGSDDLFVEYVEALSDAKSDFDRDEIYHNTFCELVNNE